MNDNFYQKPIKLMKKGLDFLIKASTMSSNVAGASRSCYEEMEKDVYVYNVNGVINLAYKDPETGEYIDIYDRKKVPSSYEFEPFSAIKYNPRHLADAAIVYGRFLEWYQGQNTKQLSKECLQKSRREKIAELQCNLTPVSLVSIGKVDSDVHQEAIAVGLRHGNVAAQHISAWEKDNSLYFEEESPRYFAYIDQGVAYILNDFRQPPEYHENGDAKKQLLTGTFSRYPVFVPDQYVEYPEGRKYAWIKSKKMLDELLKNANKADLTYIYQIWKVFERTNTEIVTNRYTKKGKVPQKHL